MKQKSLANTRYEFYVLAGWRIHHKRFIYDWDEILELVKKQISYEQYVAEEMQYVLVQVNEDKTLRLSNFNRMPDREAYRFKKNECIFWFYKRENKFILSR